MSLCRQVGKLFNESVSNSLNPWVSQSVSHSGSNLVSQSLKKSVQVVSSISQSKKKCVYISYHIKVMSFIEPKTIPLFYFNGDKATTPTCPVDLIPDLNPSSGAQSYYSSTPDCKRSAKYRIPFFLENFGPRYHEWSVSAHEARPGHHTQVNASSVELQL